MKKKCLLVIITLFSIKVSSQNTLSSRLSFSFEYINKLDKSIKLDNNPESMDYIEQKYHRHTGAILAEYRLNHHFNVEVGYSFEPFEKGWALLLDTSGILSVSPSTYLLAHSIPLRISYKIPLFNLFKRPFILEPSLGCITSIRYDDGDIGGDGGGTATSSALLLTSTNRKGIEYNIRKAIIRFEGRAQIRYEFSKTFTLYFGGGYCQGTSVIGRENAIYTRPPATTPLFIKKEYKGTNVYFNAGLRVSLAGILSDQ